MPGAPSGQERKVRTTGFFPDTGVRIDIGLLGELGCVESRVVDFTRPRDLDVTHCDTMRDC